MTAQQFAEGLTYFVVLLFSLSFHESAHAWMARRMGDDTAHALGRISLNPLVHIDPIGTVLIPLIQIFGPTGIPLMGWAKPTPVVAGNFRRISRGQILTAAAGPVSNLILAAGFTVVLFLVVRIGVGADLRQPVFALIRTGLIMNVALAVFNLIPLPPLDGSWIVSYGLPRSLAEHYDRVAGPYGQWILLLLFVTRMLDALITPFINLILRFLLDLVL